MKTLFAFLIMLTALSGQNSKKAIPFAPDVIGADHCVTAISNDGSEIYWAERPNENMHRRIFRVLVNNGKWGEPEVMPFADTEDGDCPVLAPDNRTLYFNSNRVIPGGGRRERIWYVTRAGDNWSEARLLEGDINTRHLHWQIGVDRDGNIYFGSERKGSLGRDDIFIARKTADGYADAIPLPAPVNTPSHESSPYINPDGKYILFIRSHYGGSNPPYPTGLLISYHQSDGSWSEPLRVSVPGISPEDISCPFVSPDGQKLYFLLMNRKLKQVYHTLAVLPGQPE